MRYPGGTGHAGALTEDTLSPRLLVLVVLQRHPVECEEGAVSWATEA